MTKILGLSVWILKLPKIKIGAVVQRQTDSGPRAKIFRKMKGSIEGNLKGMEYQVV